MPTFDGIKKLQSRITITMALQTFVSSLAYATPPPLAFKPRDTHVTRAGENGLPYDVITQTFKSQALSMLPGQTIFTNPRDTPWLVSIWMRTRVGPSRWLPPLLLPPLLLLLFVPSLAEQKLSSAVLNGLGLVRHRRFHPTLRSRSHRAALRASCSAREAKT